MKSAMRRLFIPDMHLPHVDWSAYNAMLDVALYFKPHEVVILGDTYDMYCLSRFDKDPTHLVNLIEKEVAPGIEVFRFLTKKFKRVVYLSGNHEARLDRFIQAGAGVLSSHITLRNVCQIPSSVRIIPYGQKNIYDMGSLIATHGSVCGKHSAEKMLLKYGRSIVYGHTHTIQSHTIRNLSGEITAFNVGWLGDFSKASYKDVNSWSHGFGLSYHLGSRYEFETVMIKDGRAMFQGRLFGRRT